MSEQVKECPLCKFSYHARFELTKFRGLMIENRICNRCGFVFQSPRMTEDESIEFYSQSYRQLYQGEEGPTNWDLQIQHDRAQNLLDFLEKHVPSVDNFLDIGSSAGVLLDQFQQFFNCRSVGVEPGKIYRKFSLDKGLEIYRDLKEIESGEEKSFDLISMIHVLEHIPDPISYLTDLRQNKLSLHGKLLLEVPNLFIHDSFEIAHMSSFSSHTLKETLKQAGFSIMAFKAHGVPRSKILPLYLTVLAKPASTVSTPKVVPEKSVRYKRNLGIFYRRIAQRLFPKLSWAIRKS